MFCPNDSLIYVWENNKTSECFVETCVAGILAAFMVIFGTAQCSVYKKYSTPLLQTAIPQSRLYYVQMIITFLIPLLSVAKFFVDMYLIQNGVVYGYQVITKLEIINFIITVSIIEFILGICVRYLF